jgi:hypothetical protein
VTPAGQAFLPVIIRFLRVIHFIVLSTRKMGGPDKPGHDNVGWF